MRTSLVTMSVVSQSLESGYALGAEKKKKKKRIKIKRP